MWWHMSAESLVVEAQLVRQQCSDPHHQVAQGPHLIGGGGTFQQRFCCCWLCFNITAVCVSTDSKGLSNPSEVEALREKVYASLEAYCKQKYPEQPGRYEDKWRRAHPQTLVLRKTRQMWLQCVFTLNPKTHKNPLNHVSPVIRCNWALAQARCTYVFVMTEMIGCAEIHFKVP